MFSQLFDAETIAAIMPVQPPAPPTDPADPFADFVAQEQPQERRGSTGRTPRPTPRSRPTGARRAR